MQHSTLSLTDRLLCCAVLSLSLCLCAGAPIPGCRQAAGREGQVRPCAGDRERVREGGEDVGKREEDGAAAAGTRDGEEEGECCRGEEPESGAVKARERERAEYSCTFVW